MATALTKEDRHLVFEIFGIPNQTSVLLVDTAFGTGRSVAIGAILTSKSEINDLIDGLEDHHVSRLQTLLAEWLKVTTSNVRIHPNVANEGVDLDPRQARQLIRQRVRIIVPVVRSGQASNQGAPLPLG